MRRCWGLGLDYTHPTWFTVDWDLFGNGASVVHWSTDDDEVAVVLLCKVSRLGLNEVGFLNRWKISVPFDGDGSACWLR